MNPAFGIVLIVQGLFLWFALAFNGGVGETFVNYSFFASALLMIILGASMFTKANKQFSLSLGIACVVLYLPMIWQRFNYKSFVDIGALMFDIIIIGLVVGSVLIRFVGKPNHPLKRDEETAGVSE